MEVNLGSLDYGAIGGAGFSEKSRGLEMVGQPLKWMS